MAIIVQIILGLLVAMFMLYAAMEWRAKGRAAPRFGSPAQQPHSLPNAEMPAVSVLLPVYNEKYVVEKLINSVCAMDYPAGKLQILVLDDSSDETGEIIERCVAAKREEGVDLARLRRPTHTGFKAGNLNYGLRFATGEFVAIFDADCLPPPDFLQKTMPYFQNEKIGFLQTGIRYHNARKSFLTRFQAAEAAHKEDVTAGSCKEGFMASLTGSSCIWRKKCIDDIGGISQETITEDVDMGYAAQLGEWKYVFPRGIVSMAELPESMASFRVQRQRWARGLAHNAFRHAHKLFAAPMRPLERAHAISLVFSPLLLALFYLLLLLSPFLALATPHLGLFFNAACVIFLLAAIFWGWLNTSDTNGHLPDSRSPLTAIGGILGYVLIFFPLSLYYFSAIIQVICLGKGEFHTTPKGTGRKKIPQPVINNILLYLEIFSFFYTVFAAFLAVSLKNYWVLLYALLSMCGFGMTLFFSFSDSLKKISPGSHILITGASGSLGQALASVYAAPGIHLTLQGRNPDKLEQIAAECRQKGAFVSIKALDLLQTEQVRAWAVSLADDPPSLVIANAGLNTNIGPDAEGELYENALNLVKVNFLSVMALVYGLLPAMRRRKSGQIALMSSLAGCYGLIHTPTYSATKAALRIWGASLRGWLAPEGIQVNVIMPGYVESPMCAAMPGPKPFLWQPDKAARLIRKGLERNCGRISFPFPLNLGMWALSILPLWLAMPIARFLGYGR